MNKLIKSIADSSAEFVSKNLDMLLNAYDNGELNDSDINDVFIMLAKFVADSEKFKKHKFTKSDIVAAGDLCVEKLHKFSRDKKALLFFITIILCYFGQIIVLKKRLAKLGL